jgi:hypothetical protein
MECFQKSGKYLINSIGAFGFACFGSCFDFISSINVNLTYLYSGNKIETVDFFTGIAFSVLIFPVFWIYLPIVIIFNTFKEMIFSNGLDKIIEDLKKSLTDIA